MSNLLKDKNLVAMHVTNSRSIPQISETGIAMPSFGIAHKDNLQGVQHFGDVTLIAHKSKIDPKTVPTYDRDVYSPRWDSGDYLKDKQGGKLELTPENEKKIIDRMRARGVKLGEYEGRVKAGKRGRWEQVLHGLISKRFNSLRDLKYAVPKKLSVDGKYDWKLKDLPKELPPASASSAERLCVKALRMGKLPSDYIKQQQALGKDPLEGIHFRAKGELVEGHPETGRVLDQWILNLKHHIKQPYFEAKPQRFFHLNDFAAAVVPEHDQEAIERLTQHGVKVYPYSSKSITSGEKRLNAIRQAAEENDLMFSEDEPELDALVKSELAGMLELQKDEKIEEIRHSKPSTFVGYHWAPDAASARQLIDSHSKRALDDKRGLFVSDTPDSWASPWVKGYTLVHSRVNLKKPYVLKNRPLESVWRDEIDKLKNSGYDSIVNPPSPDGVSWTRQVLLLNPNSQLERIQLSGKTAEDAANKTVWIRKSEGPSSPCVLTVITDGMGKMLFIKRNDNKKWSLCAGHMEAGEEPEEAARREILEETGLEPEYLTRIPGCDFPNMTCFTAQCQGMPHGRNDPDNEGEAQWVDIRYGIPSNIWDNLHGPQDDRNVVHKLFSKALGINKSEYEWLDAGFLDLEKLVKGSMARLAPFDADKAKQADQGALNDAYEAWVLDANKQARNDLASFIPPEAKARSLHRLHGLTETRRNPISGEREFLLHRAHSHEEDLLGDNDRYVNNKHSSWTPIRRNAEHFNEGLAGHKKYPLITSAWIPESAIKGYIPILGSYRAPKTYPTTTVRDEQEVLVGPGKFHRHYSMAKAEIKLVHQPKESQERNLLAVHNLTAENLQHAHELGGLAAPSIAIHHKNHPFDNYGEITLVAHPSLIDPEHHVPVFNADAYSARHPRPNYRVDKKKLTALTKELYPHAEKVQESSHLLNSFPENVENRGIQEAINDRSMHPILQAAYLHEKGHDAPSLKRNVPLTHKFVQEKPVQDFFTEHGIHSPEYRDEEDVEGKRADAEYAKKLTELVRGLPGDERLWKDHFNDDGILEPWVVRNIAKDAWNVGKTEPDRWGTQEAIEKKLKDLGLEDDYERWAINKMKPIQGTPYIPKGRKKVPYTMENILKEVLGTGGRGVAGTEKSGAFYGTGFARSKGAKKFSSLEDIRRHQGQLVSEEEMKGVKDKLSEQFSQIADKMARYHSVGGFHTMDALVSALGASYRSGRSLTHELRRDGFEGVPPHLVEELRQYGKDLVNSGTEYFEAKPQRNVQLQEFHGAVVPDTVKPSTLEILKRHGLGVKHYKSGDQKDRLRAVNELADEGSLKLSEEELKLPELLK